MGCKDDGFNDDDFNNDDDFDDVVVVDHDFNDDFNDDDDGFDDDDVDFNDGDNYSGNCKMSRWSLTPRTWRSRLCA